MFAPSALGQWGGPAKVTVANVELRQLPATTTLVGTVEPVTRSVIGSEIAGLVEQMPVRQGDFVGQGDLICKLRADTLVYGLAEARARLESLKAQHRRWAYELERINRLYGEQDASEKEAYETRASHDEAQHDVTAQEAVVGRLESDLAKTAIRAPFSGFIVVRHSEVGQWIDQGGDVVEMADLSSVLVGVDLPESALPHVKVGQTASVRIEALQRRFEGRVRHVILQADPSARTFPVEVEIPNPGYLAWSSATRHGTDNVAADSDEPPGDSERTRVEQPAVAGQGDGHEDAGPVLLAGGMFARVTMVCGPPTMLPAVPKDAIVSREGVEYVSMVAPGREEGSLMAIPMPVTTGVDIGDWIAVTSGNLAPNMQVVTRGNESILFPSPIEIVEYGDQGSETSAASAAAEKTSKAGS
jgi:RND family efflux transporter MFP subunit